MSATPRDTHRDCLLILSKGGRGNRQHIVHDLFYAGHSTVQVRQFLKDAGYSKSRRSQLMKEATGGTFRGKSKLPKAGSKAASRRARGKRELKFEVVDDPIEDIEDCDDVEHNQKKQKYTKRKHETQFFSSESSGEFEKIVKTYSKKHKSKSSSFDPSTHKKSKAVLKRSQVIEKISKTRPKKRKPSTSTSTSSGEPYVRQWGSMW